DDDSVIDIESLLIWLLIANLKLASASLNGLAILAEKYYKYVEPPPMPVEDAVPLCKVAFNWQLSKLILSDEEFPSRTSVEAVPPLSQT
ncbi:MAG: hypothetical protein ACI82O_002920, partial [Patiriisocius sp.]